MTEAKSAARHHDGRSQRAEHFLDELLGLFLLELVREPEDKGLLDTERFEQLQPPGQR